MSSPVSKSSRSGVPSSVPKSSNGERPYSASRPIKEENYSPSFKNTDEVSSSSRHPNSREESRNPASKQSKIGSPTPRFNLVKTRKEDEDSQFVSGSAVQRLSLASHGTAGQEVNLQTNCFEMTFDAGVQLYQYHVHMVPEPKTARQRKRAFDLFLKEADFLRPLRHGTDSPAFATDYRSALITTERINPRADKEHERHQCIVAYYEAEADAPKKTPSIHSHMFKASFCQVLPLRNLEDYLHSPSGRAWSKVNGSILHALSLIVARKHLNVKSIAQTKNDHRYFPDAEPLVVLGGGLIARQGYQTVMGITNSRLLVNINPRIGIYYREDSEGSLLDLIKDFRVESKDMGKLQEFVKGIRVNLPHLSSHGGRVKIESISGLASSPDLGANAHQVSFRWNNQEITVSD